MTVYDLIRKLARYRPETEVEVECVDDFRHVRYEVHGVCRGGSGDAKKNPNPVVLYCIAREN